MLQVVRYLERYRLKNNHAFVLCTELLQRQYKDQQGDQSRLVSMAASVVMPRIVAAK